MAALDRHRWDGDPSSGLARRDRQGCDYDSYLPDPLMGRPLSLDGTVAADIADAEAAITRFNLERSALANSEALARLLLRAESVASSRIEGLEVGGRRLLRAEAARALGDEPQDVTAEEVLGNISAMTWAVDALADIDRITVDHLREVHHRLVAGTRLESQGGHLREEQNWIGGSSFNPCSAAFVPPPPEHVLPLLEDLCAFCNEDSLPAIAQAALAHAQYETIHPFADGNGRSGRALIHVLLRRRGLAPRVTPPISLVLATWADEYVAGLTATRYIGPADATEARAGLNRWIALFAAAGRRAVPDAESYQAAIGEIKVVWRNRLGQVRAGSATELLVGALPGAPILTVASAADLIGRTFQATNEAVSRLVDAGVLQQINVGRRNRAFEAGELIDAFTDLERRLASPEAHTRSSPPRRGVPRR